eukprot:Em0001g2282a
MELDENVQPASSRRSYTLSKDVLPPLETLVVTIVGATELDGTTDIDNSDSTEANLRVLYPLDRFGIAKNPAVFASGNHTIAAVVKADSFVNVNGNPYPIELFLSSDMKLVYALTLGLNGANSIYACPFCTMHQMGHVKGRSALYQHCSYILVQACTSGGCGQSNSSSLKTLQAMPTFQAAPNVTALNAVTALSNPNGLLIHTCGPSSPLIPSSMSLQWNAPLQPDYVITAYTLHHRVPSLKSQSEMPQSSSIPRTPAAFSSTNGVMTDFLGVKLHGGLPWLIFDVGSGPAVVGSNSTRTFNDGHMVLFEQASNTFYVTVDTVHAAAITAMIVPLLTMKVYFEGFPSTSSRYGIATPYSMCLIPS